MTQDSHFPLSAAQLEIWLGQALAPDSALYNVGEAVRLPAALDVTQFREALATAIAETDALHVQFTRSDRGPLQRRAILPRWTLVEAEIASTDEREIAARLQSECRTPIDLEGAALFRSTLFRLPDGTFVWCQIYHHIVMDGLSRALVAKRVAEVYAARSRGEAELPPPFGSYTELLRYDLAYTGSHRAETDLTAWRTALEGFVPTRQAPAPAKGAGFLRQTEWLDAATSSTLRTLAKTERISVAQVLSTIATVLSATLSGETDVVIGLVVAARDEDAVRTIPGAVSNIVPMRLALDPHMHWRALLDLTRKSLRFALEHQRCRLEDIRRDLGMVGQGADLTGIVVNVIPFFERLDFGPFDPRLDNLSNGPVDDWSIVAYTHPDEARIRLDFNANAALHDDAALGRFRARALRFLSALTGDLDARVGSVDLLLEGERGLVLDAWNDTGAPEIPLTPAAWFEAQVARTPDALALVCGTQRWTYRTLGARANRIAHTLGARGIGLEDRVAIVLDRTLDLVAAQIAVLKSGAAYIPIDASYPPARIAAVMRDAAVRCALTDRANADRLPDALPRIRLDGDALAEADHDPAPGTGHHRLRPHSAAYVIYTSGSTGVPKGVLIEQRGVTDLIAWAHDTYGDALTRVFVTTSLCFDVSVFEILAPLCRGGRIDLLDNLLALAECVDDAEEPAMISGVPSALASLLDHAALPPRLSAVVLAGEALPARLVRRLRTERPGCRISNVYGPTEATVYATAWHAPDDEADDDGRAPPIGRPVRNMRVYVLDAALRPLPPGVAGDLYLAGIGLARGYLDRATLTAERFVADPFGGPGARMYLTGDRARWRADGTLDYLGRSDHQLKVRGYRVEPGEIEERLVLHPALADAVVVPRDLGSGLPSLVAYVVAKTGVATPTPEILRAHLAEALPDYMVPPVFVPIDALPLNANGKLDRAALPVPALGNDTPARPPQTPNEIIVAELFEHVLQTKNIDANTNFFHTGGDSISALRLVARGRAKGLSFSPRDIFRHQTLAQLAAAALPVGTTSEAEIIPGTTLPTTPIIRWMQGRRVYERFSQSVVVDAPCTLTPALLAEMLDTLAARHDALRLRLVGDDVLDVLPPEPGRFARAIEIVSAAVPIETVRAEAVDLLRPRDGHLLEARIIETDEKTAGRLLLVLHHLAVDGVSWRILTNELAILWRMLTGEAADEALPPVTASYRLWAHRLAAFARTTEVVAHLGHWQSVQNAPALSLTGAPLDARRDVVATRQCIDIVLSPEETRAILDVAPGRLDLRANDIFLGALLAAARVVAGVDDSALRIDLEGHGREDIIPGLDIGQTVGWFTSVFPVLLVGPCGGGAKALRTLLAAVKETLRRQPANGVSYGLLRYLNDETSPRLASAATPEVAFNYLGRFAAEDRLWATSADHRSLEASRDPDMALAHAIEVLARVDETADGPVLRVEWAYAPAIVAAETVQRLAESWRDALASIGALASHATVAPIVTPADVPLVPLGQSEIDEIVGRTPDLETILPLTPLQEGLLFHSLYDERYRDTYIVQLVATLAGAVDADRLRDACRGLIARHPMLRASFEYYRSEKPLQLIAATTSLDWEIHDLAGAAAESAWLDADQARRFDPTRTPLVRFALLRRADAPARLVVTMHHLLLDGWSIPILARDLEGLYARAPLAPAASHALFMEWLATQDQAPAIAQWRDRLEHAEPPTPVVADDKRASRMIAAVTRAALTEDDTASLARTASRLGTTPSVLVQAAWALLLARLTRRRDVTFGITVSGRPPDLPGADRIVGLLINTLPLHVAVDPNATVHDFCRSVGDEVGFLIAHPNVPLVELQRIAGRRDLFDTLVVYESYPDRERSATTDGFRIASIEGRETSHYPLSLLALPGRALAFRLNYRADLFEAGAAEDILARLLRLIMDLCDSPERRLGSLVATPVTAAIEGAPARSFRSAVVRFASHAAERPDAIAIETEHNRLSYATLAAWSDAIAADLAAAGIGTERRVAVLFERGPQLAAALLGVLKAGATFVPLDPSQPTDRLRALIATAGTDLTLTSKAGAARLQELRTKVLDEPQTAVGFVPTPTPEESSAYLLFTSGTTGTPKGVVVTHRGLSNYVDWAGGAYQLGAGAGTAVTTSIAFDATITSFLLPLLCGERVLLLAEDRQFETLLVRPETFSLLKVTPSQVGLLAKLATGDRLARIARRLVIGGEALSAETIAPWRRHAPRTVLVNEYGPTETVVGCVVYEVQPDDPETGGVAIGTPIDGTRLLVLDESLQPTPVGIPGELYIAGAGLARGYHGRPDLTSERFVATPAGPPGARMYRTGDLVVRRVDNSLLFLGRTDEQLKVRGHRIEPAEIESALRRLPGVGDSLVLAFKDDDKQRLVGYVVAAHVSDDWRAALALALPEFMVPDELVALDAFPLTRNDKIDRAALSARRTLVRDFAAPATPAEVALAEIVAKLLKIERVGRDESFFALGGDSILSIQLVSRARKAGYVLKPQQIFELQTVAALAAAATPLAKGPAAAKRDAPSSGFPALPIMDWLRRRGGPTENYAQSFLVSVPPNIGVERVADALKRLAAAHEMLRARLCVDAKGLWSFENLSADTMATPILRTARADDREAAIERERGALAALLAPTRGAMLSATLFEDASTLLVCVHHLACDGVSCRILSQDLADLFAGQTIEVPTTTLGAFAREQSTAAPSAELAFWREQLGADGALVADARLDAKHDVFGTRGAITTPLDAALSKAVLGQICEAFNASIDDILLAALVVAVARRRNADCIALSVDLEGHGRDGSDEDLTRTVGWLTVMYPLRLSIATSLGRTAIAQAVTAVKEQRRRIPGDGRGYGALRARDSDGTDSVTFPEERSPQILFNYLGQASGGLEGFGAHADPKLPLAHVLSMNAIAKDATDGKAIRADWSFAPRLIPEADVAAIARLWHEALSELAGLVAEGHRGRSPSDFPLMALSQPQVDRLLRAVPDAAEVHPLAPLQEGLLFHARYDGAASTLYISQLVLDLEGDVDPERMRDASVRLVARHESLRATFLDTDDGRPCQVIRASVTPAWMLLDRPASDEIARIDAVRRIMDDDRAIGFRLDRSDPLVRFTLVRHAPQRFSLLSTFHHILIDGWSMPTIISDLIAFHADPNADRPTAAKRADYFRWLAQQDRDTARASWLASLEGLDQPVRLAGASAVGDGPRLQIRRRLDPALEKVLGTLARAEGVTLATIMQVTWAILLGRLTRRDDVVFGTTVGGRPAELPSIETGVGLYINTLPLRVVLRADEPLRDLLRRLQAAQAALLPHHHLGLTEIQRAVGLGELFDTLLAYENYPLDRAAFAAPVGGIRVSRVWGSDAAHYPLSVVVVPNVQTEVRFNARADLLAQTTVEAIADRFVTLLKDIASQPGQVTGMLGRPKTPAARIAPLSLRFRSIAEAFATTAAARGDAVAMVHGDDRMRYAELEASANRLARHLRALGVHAGAPVIVMRPRGFGQVVAMLAVLTAGAFYIPLDEALPAARVADIVAESRAAFAIVGTATADRLPAGVVAISPENAAEAEVIAKASATAPQIVAHPLAAAYVIYTSGSTGRPKGVVVTHANVLRLFEATRQFGFDSRDCWTLFHSAAFDFSVWEIWGALLYGGRLVVVPWETSRDAAAFLRLLVAEGVSVLNQTPSAFYQLIDAVEAAPDLARRLALRLVIFGGEALDTGRLKPWFARFGTERPQLVNMYGITETTVHVSHLPLPVEAPGGGSPIGHPIADLHVRLLDTALQEVPDGIVGEIFVGGGGVSRGYLGRPDLTAERFVADPTATDGSQLYRTGDLARRLPNRSLVYIGRSDHQVKIRGFRIELGEIESRLAAIEGVGQAAVAVREDSTGRRRLVAYVTMDSGASVEAAGLRHGLAAYLPDYMIPSTYVRLDALPLTRNGKLDRAALPAPDRVASERTAPRNERETTLCGFFTEVLGLPDIGIRDSFFALGGDSLLAMRLMALIRARLQTECSIRTLFDHPTVEELAGNLDIAAIRDPLEGLIGLRARGSGTPLFCIHPGGGLSWVYARLMRHLPPDQPIYGLQARGFADGDVLPTTIEAMAEDYLAAMRTVQPKGPYRVTGWSFGGLVAYAIAARLEAIGETADLVALLDAYPVRAADQTVPLSDDALIEDQMSMMGVSRQPSAADASLRDTLLVDRGILSTLRPRDIEAIVRITRNNVRMATGWAPPPLHGSLHLFVANAGLAPPFDWSDRVGTRLHRHDIACRHGDMLKPVPLEAICRGLAEALDDDTERNPARSHTA